MKEIRFVCGVVLTLFFALSLASCGGGGSDDSGTGGMSQGEAEAFSAQISRAAAYASPRMAYTEAPDSEPALPEVTETRDLLEDRSVQCTQTSCTIYQPFSATTNCTAGGRIVVSGDISGTMNSSGTGLIQIQATETITDWRCITGHVINGDPYISLTGTFSYVNGSPGTQQTVSLSGGFKWGTTAAQSCQIQLRTNFNSNGQGTTSGVVCGRTVYATF